jgi:hypothetical protein
VKQRASGKPIHPPGGDIDPLRIVVWVSFSALLLAAWIGILWVVWKLVG